MITQSGLKDEVKKLLNLLSGYSYPTNHPSDFVKVLTLPHHPNSLLPAN
jgi:hypothetical protein